MEKQKTKNKIKKGSDERKGNERRSECRCEETVRFPKNPAVPYRTLIFYWQPNQNSKPKINKKKKTNKIKKDF